MLLDTAEQIKHILTFLTVFSLHRPAGSSFSTVRRRIQWRRQLKKGASGQWIRPASVTSPRADSALCGGGAYPVRVAELNLSVQRSWRLEGGSAPESVAIWEVPHQIPNFSSVTISWGKIWSSGVFTKCSFFGVSNMSSVINSKSTFVKIKCVNTTC